MQHLFRIGFKIYGFFQSSYFPLTTSQFLVEKGGLACTLEEENEDGKQSMSKCCCGSGSHSNLHLVHMPFSCPGEGERFRQTHGTWLVLASVVKTTKLVQISRCMRHPFKIL